MTFAVIKTGGKQYKVVAGDRIKVEKLAGDAASLVFDEVLLVDDGRETKVGNPTVAGAKVTAKRLADGRRDKVTVIHYKAKSNYRKKAGHRQPYTEIQIEKIG